MDEIKIWKIAGGNLEKPAIVALESVQATQTEQLLEDILTATPDLLMPNLHVVGRQTETPGGPLDLLGVDEEGRLVVFELKRGMLTRDAVAQAIDYASYLADLDTEQLCQHIANTSGKGGTEKIEDFAQWYQTTFQASVNEIGKPRIALVGLGVDERTRRMVSFLADSEVDISLLTFHGFRHEGETLLARQVEVKPRESTETVKVTKQNNQAKLDQLLASLGVKHAFETTAQVLRQGLGDSTYTWPNTTGYSYYLPEITENGKPSNRAYMSLSILERNKGCFLLVLQARAMEAIGEGAAQTFAAEIGSKLHIKPSGYGEILLKAELPDEAGKASLTKLSQTIIACWKNKVSALGWDLL